MSFPDFEAPRCTVGQPTSRRFYVHERSFGGLLAVQPSSVSELAGALALSAAGRAVEQVVEDGALFGHSDVDPGVKRVAEDAHQLAALALQEAFQCLVHLVPPRFGATEPLLGADEEITAWCYEDGYFTYATDEAAAKVMYLETGSLHELRSRIRRDPDADPTLRMISGDSLFHFDQALETASAYKKQHARLLRHAKPVDLPALLAVGGVVESEFAARLSDVADGAASADVLARCRRGIRLTLSVLGRSWAEAAGMPQESGSLPLGRVLATA